MTKVRMGIAIAITTVWVVGYLLAFFVDRSLQGLAQSVTPVLLIAASAIFGTEAIQLFKGKGDDTGT